MFGTVTTTTFTSPPTLEQQIFDPVVAAMYTMDIKAVATFWEMHYGAEFRSSDVLTHYSADPTDVSLSQERRCLAVAARRLRDGGVMQSFMKIQL